MQVETPDLFECATGIAAATVDAIHRLIFVHAVKLAIHSVKHVDSCFVAEFITKANRWRLSKHIPVNNAA